MAYRKKATEVAENTTEKVTPVSETKEATEVKKTEKRKFEPDEGISCVSITPGEMFFKGEKSETLYTFADADYVVDIEYKDLKYAVERRNAMVFKPRFIIQNEDFLAQYPALNELYSGLYSSKDLRNILKSSPSELRKIIPTLPLGAQDALKNMAATMIDNGTLDSVQRIKALDELFDTEMLLRLQN